MGVLKLKHNVDKIYIPLNNDSYSKDVVDFVIENKHEGMEVIYVFDGCERADLFYELFTELKTHVSQSIRMKPECMNDNLLNYCLDNEIYVCLDFCNNVNNVLNYIDVIKKLNKVFVLTSPSKEMSVKDILRFLDSFRQEHSLDLQFLVSFEDSNAFDSDADCLRESMEMYMNSSEEITEFEVGYINSFLSKLKFYKSYNHIFCRKNMPYQGRKSLCVSLDGCIYTTEDMNNELCHVCDEYERYVNSYTSYGDIISEKYVERCMGCPVNYICDGEYLPYTDEACDFNKHLVLPIIMKIAGAE